MTAMKTAGGFIAPPAGLSAKEPHRDAQSVSYNYRAEITRKRRAKRRCFMPNFSLAELSPTAIGANYEC